MPSHISISLRIAQPPGERSFFISVFETAWISCRSPLIMIREPECRDQSSEKIIRNNYYQTSYISSKIPIKIDLNQMQSNAMHRIEKQVPLALL